jgi:drug/metabolite transporter (DMT)-like permease
LPPSDPRSTLSPYAKGLFLTALGGMVLTVDIPLIRLADGDVWSVLLMRSGATLVVALLLWVVWRLWRGNAPALVPGRAGAAVAALYGLGSVLFMLAVFNTSTANLVFILAFNTAFAALLSWAFLRERPHPVTLAAIAVMIGAVLLIVGDGIGRGNLLGDMLGLGSAFAIASAITVTRASGRDMGLTALVAVALPLAVAAFMVAENGFRVTEPGWMLLNGAIVMPVAFFCLATGPKYISGPEVAMFYLLETVLAPVWVWIIFAEAPSRVSLIGGALLVLTLFAHSLWQLETARRRRATPLPRHPA